MVKLDKKRLNTMRSNEKTLYIIYTAYVCNLGITMYSMWYYPYYISIGLLLICALLLLLMYKFKEKITDDQ